MTARRPPSVTRARVYKEIYDEIPAIPACTGWCSRSCGPIACFRGEWERMTAAAGGPIGPLRGLTCPLLSANGRCTVYQVRPLICRLWGTTRALACPQGCQPERWVTDDEAVELLKRLFAVAGPELVGPRGATEHVAGLIKTIQRAAEHHRDEGLL